MKPRTLWYLPLTITALLCLWFSAFAIDTSFTDGSSDTAFSGRIQHPPILCYHQVRDWTGNDSKTARAYITSVIRFAEQMKMLHDSGYHTILPGELVNYYLHNMRLPGKPIVLCFDDGTISQYTNALPVLNKYGFKATFFIMTVTLNRNGYMSNEQVKALADQGHVIGCHTWDHHNVKDYNSNDWQIQLIKPTQVLKNITGKPITYFAYPFGSWDTNAVRQLKANGYQAAFQLAGKQDTHDPLFTFTRICVDGRWDAKALHLAIKQIH